MLAQKIALETNEQERWRWRESLRRDGRHPDRSNAHQTYPDEYADRARRYRTQRRDRAA